MAGADDDPQSMRLELAILGMRGSVDVRLTEITGSLALLNQRSEAADRRADEREKLHEERSAEITTRVNGVDERLDVVERVMVTREELERREQQNRAAIEEKSRRQLVVVGLILTVLGIGSGSVTSTIIAIVN